MIVRRLAVALFVVLGAHTARAQTPATAADTWTPAALEAMAVAHHPAIQAAAAGVDVARGAARQAGLWPNPRVVASAESTKSEPGAPRGEYTWMAEQTIPLGGRLRLARETLLREADRSSASADGVRQRVVNDVRARIVDVRDADARLALARRFVAYADTAADIARQLFNTGVADQPDVLRAEVEAETLRLRLAAAEDARHRAWRQVALAVGDPSLPERPITGEVRPQVERETALASILDAHPALAAARAESARAAASLARAKAEWVPDLTVGAGPRYTRERVAGSASPVGWEPVLSVGVHVPLWNRNQGGVAAATADGRAAGATMRAIELALRRQFEDVWLTYATASRAGDAYAAVIVPKATAAFEMSLARYRAMALGYPLVLTAQRALLEAEDAALDAEVRRARAAVWIQGLLVGSEGGM